MTPRQKRPCAECPWRVDVAPGQFPAERYEALRETTYGDDGHAGFGAPMFACHKAPEGGEFACAGWLAVCGYDNVTVRVLVAQGEIPVEALEPADGWPELHRDYDEMVAAKGAA